MYNLTRFAYGPHATLGRLVVEGHTFFTVERPWLGNRPFESCIPQGVYAVEAYSSPKYPDVWELQEVPGRSKILIHAGNWASDVQGCIAVGMGLRDWGVSSSRVAMAKLQELLPERFTLNVTQFIPEYP